MSPYLSRAACVILAVPPNICTQSFSSEHCNGPWSLINFRISELLTSSLGCLHAWPPLLWKYTLYSQFEIILDDHQQETRPEKDKILFKPKNVKTSAFINMPVLILINCTHNWISNKRSTSQGSKNLYLILWQHKLNGIHLKFQRKRDKYYNIIRIKVYKFDDRPEIES